MLKTHPTHDRHTRPVSALKNKNISTFDTANQVNFKKHQKKFWIPI